MTVSVCTCETGLPPREDWNDSVTETGTPLPFLSAFFSAFAADVLGFNVKLTLPEPATALLPLAKMIFAGRHLPASLMKPLLHWLLDANAPNLPFWKVASQLKVPRSATASLNVIAPVAGLKVPTRAVNAPFGVTATVVSAVDVGVAAGPDGAAAAGGGGCGGGGGGGGGEATVMAWPVDGPVASVSASFGVIVTVYSPAVAYV